MRSGIKQSSDLTAVPLQTAVLCVNCECVTSGGHMDRCPLCGSRALLNLAKVIGGADPSSGPTEDDGQTRYNVEIAIDWKQLQPSDLNGAVESISSLIGPWLVRGQASCHIDVSPALSVVAEEKRAA